MNTSSPVDTVTQLINAVNQGNLDAAVACYETDAILIAQPGHVATGKKAIRETYAGFIAMKVTITNEAHKVIQTGDIALFTSRWNAAGTAPDGSTVKMGGASSDVLRRHADGRWLIAIDNPYGVAILD